MAPDKPFAGQAEETKVNLTKPVSDQSFGNTGLLLHERDQSLHQTWMHPFPRK